MKIQTRILSVLLAAVLLAACGRSNGSGGSNAINGTYGYADRDGSVAITFSPDGTALLDLNNGGQHMSPTVKYTIEDGKITLHSPTGEGGDVVLTRNPDGSLQSPWGPQPLRPQR